MASALVPRESLAATSPYDVRLHTFAAEFLAFASKAMFEEERSSNIILAHAKARQAEEGSGIRSLFEGGISQIASPTVDTASPPAAVGSEFWLTMWTKTQDPQPLVFLSCIGWTLGAYPIFLWSPKANIDIAPDERTKQMVVLAQRLHRQVEPQRVFSVFGRTDLVTTFAKLWEEQTGFEPEATPFYDAFLTYCTKNTFKPVSASFIAPDKAFNLPSGHFMRAADVDDLESVAERCREFSEESVYFPLTLEKAKIEAQLLIKKQQIWVYAVDGKAVSICAVTRSTDNVAAITKVFTTGTSRKKGFAERLVRMVTEKLLENKSAVVLYVGVDNDAQHVYDKIGFVGLRGNQDPNVERALELGFKETNRGHW